MTLIIACKEYENIDTTFLGKTYTDTSPKLVSRSSWVDIKKSGPYLRRVHRLLLAGKEPTKKEKYCKDIKFYLSAKSTRTEFWL